MLSDTVEVLSIWLSASSAVSSAVSGDAGMDYTDVQVSQIKRITANRLLQSKTTVPHYYLSVEVQVDEMNALRSTLNAQLAKDGGKVSVNDFIIKASALALKKVPEVNASWQGDFIRQYHNVDISVAVQTAAGLMVPIVRDADLKGLTSISADVKELAGKVWLSHAMYCTTSQHSNALQTSQTCRFAK